MPRREAHYDEIDDALKIWKEGVEKTRSYVFNECHTRLTKMRSEEKVQCVEYFTMLKLNDLYNQNKTNIAFIEQEPISNNQFKYKVSHIFKFITDVVNAFTNDPTVLDNADKLVVFHSTISLPLEYIRENIGLRNED